MNKSLRHLLGVIAAKGILGHNTAVSMPDQFSARELQRLLPEESEDALLSGLVVLTDLGLLRRYNTGHSGYGNTYIDGPDVWSITAKGLLELWDAAG